MQTRDTERAIAMADRFILKAGIVDEDIKQELYVVALQTRSELSPIVTRKFIAKLEQLQSPTIVTEPLSMNKNVEDPHNCLDCVMLNDMQDVMEKLFGTLTEMEKQVLILKIGFKDVRTHTSQEIGYKYDLPTRKIDEIYQTALRKLRHPARAGYIREYA